MGSSRPGGNGRGESVASYPFPELEHALVEMICPLARVPRPGHPGLRLPSTPRAFFSRFSPFLHDGSFLSGPGRFVGRLRFPSTEGIGSRNPSQPGRQRLSPKAQRVRQSKTENGTWRRQSGRPFRGKAKVRIEVHLPKRFPLRHSTRSARPLTQGPVVFVAKRP
jgi:hypothetical protein